MTANNFNRFNELADFVYKQSGIILKTQHAQSVQMKLQPLAETWGLKDVDELVAHLQRQRNNAKVIDEVLNALTIKETSFFRDRRPFDAMRKTIFPELAEKRGNRPIKLWSAACSTGQEPLSLAITAIEALGGAQTPADKVVNILGTDISEAAVARAKEGLYPDLEIRRGVTPEVLRRFFQQDGDGWRPNPDLRRAIRYRVMNLQAPDFPLPQFDVISCRNVLIYFDPDGKKAALDEIHRRLRPDGYLFTGAGEDPARMHDGFTRLRVGGVQCFQKA